MFVFLLFIEVGSGRKWKKEKETRRDQVTFKDSSKVSSAQACAVRAAAQTVATGFKSQSVSDRTEGGSSASAVQPNHTLVGARQREPRTCIKSTQRSHHSISSCNMFSSCQELVSMSQRSENAFQLPVSYHSHLLAFYL